MSAVSGFLSLCAYLCLWVHAYFMCVSGGHVFRCIVYLNRIPNISHPLPPSLHPGFVFVQNETYSWQSWLHMRAHLRNAPGMLYSTPCMSKCRGLVGGSHFCHHRRWMGSSNHTSSITINGLPVGITFPQGAKFTL